MPDNAEAAFVTGVSKQTGIDPRVLFAWVKAEGAYAPHGTGGLNYLNLRPYPGDPYSGVSAGNFEQFTNVQDAIAATVRRLQQPFAAPIEQAAQKHETPRQQISAIAATGWDSGHYGGPGGPNLAATFAGMFGGASALDSPYWGPDKLVGIATHGGFGSTAGGSVGGVGGAVASGVGSTVGAAGSALTAGERALKFLTSWRFVEVIGGFLLLLVGLYLLGRQFGVSAPLPGPFVPAARAAGSADLARFESEPGSVGAGNEQAIGEARAYTRRRPRKRYVNGPGTAGDRPARRPGASRPAQSDEVPF